MRLLSLKLSNFQGIKEFELKPNGEDISVLGANATGKTTLFNAFTWLLFGKDSLGQANFEIKQLAEDGKVIAHGLTHEVEAIIENGDGQRISLKKVFAEKWTRKRGAADKEFTGHTVDHWINGVPTKAGEYSAAISQMADEQLFRQLTNPRYFNEQLHWKDRRQILLSVSGDVSDADVIASNPALAELPGILGSHTLENYRKIITGRRTEVNRELSDVPVRISECQKGIVVTANTDLKHATSKLTVLRTDLAAKQQEKARIETGGEIAEKTKALREVESKLLDLDNQERRARRIEARTRDEKLSGIRSEISAGEIAINRAISRIEDGKKRITDLHAQVESLRSEWRAIDAQAFEFEQSSTCPTCGQSLPEEQLETARRKALEDFNQSKATHLAGISSEGKAKGAEVLKLLQDRETEESAVKKIEDHNSDLRARLQGLESQPEASPGDNPERTALLEAKDAIESVISRLREGSTGAGMDNLAEIQAIEAEISSQEALIAQIDLNAKGEARIKELKAQERKLASEYERIEKELYLTDLFIRAKVSMLTEKINSKFILARFKLFSEQINGGIEPCAEVMVDGVPYGSLNSAMRINVGLDIINTLSKHHGVTAPIFCDNAESVVDLLKTDAQQIRLVVSGNHKTLTIGE